MNRAFPSRRHFLGHAVAALGAAAAASQLPALRGAIPAAPAVPTKPAPNLLDLFSLDDVEAAARAILPPAVYAYISGAAGSENTVRWNRERYQDLKLAPRVLVDVSELDTSTTLLGRRLSLPILLAPTASHRLSHDEGELATARGAGAAGVTMVLSSSSNTPVEDVVRAATQPVWFQLYVPKDRGFARDLVQRVNASGVEALCMTVDNPVTGARNTEQRAKLVYPPGVGFPHYIGMGEPSSSVTLDQVRPAQLTWKDVEWLRSITRLPVVVKGVLNPLDAAIAVDAGVAGIVVSNHGGRDLDTLPASIDALPRVAERVAGRVPLLVDGGIRRGTDVVKALARGATAVLIGRPYVYGLAVGGAAGVTHVVKILRQELLLAMALTGRPKIGAIDRSVLWE
jgi:4-hydroxymandelate oxidase